MKNFRKYFLRGSLSHLLPLGAGFIMASSKSLEAALGMSVAITIVTVLSAIIVSALRKVIPDSLRIPGFIVVVASFVTIVDFLLEGFVPSLYSALGVYIPLIVVNCIILGRAESYASKNPIIPSLFDGLGMGLGFTVGLTAIGIVRELIGAGQAFGLQVLPVADAAAGTGGYVPVTIFILAPGAFIVLACLVAVQNKIKANAAKKGKEVKESAGCGEGGCSSCSGCGGNVFPAGNDKE